MPSRIEVLEATIARYRVAYYNGEAIAEDDTYDALVEELASLKADSPQVLAIGSPPTTGFPKVRHKIPMGSLSKVTTPEAMQEWFQQVARSPQEPLIATDKLDGLSVSIEYRAGEFYQAVSRGGGDEGEDISRNVAAMQGVPARLPEPIDVTVRGEIVLPKATLETTYKALGYSNTRNAASGISRRHDGTGCQDLAVYCYWLSQPTETVVGRFERLNHLGFRVPSAHTVSYAPGVKTPSDLRGEYQQTLREALPYDIDGLVLELNDFHYQESLGVVSGRPKGAIAFKFDALGRETVATGRVDQVGGRGHITPVAVFEPVSLLGAEVTRASLYNQAYIEAIGFDIGATILVSRANDVIPRVVRVVQGTGTVSAPPTVCPECGTPVVREGEYLKCPNTEGCPAQTEGRLLHWCRELGILEWGPALIAQVVAQGARDVADLYALSLADLAALDRMGRASAEKAYGSLRAPLPLPLDKILGALSIPLCGTTTMQLVVSSGFSTVESLLAAKPSDLEAIPGMGPKRASALTDWLRGNRDLLAKLEQVGISPKPAVQGALTGQSFCFTGTMQRKRGDLEALVEKAGGTVKDRVGKGLTCLVAARTDSSKAEAARKYGTRVLTEQQFLGLVGA